MSQEDAAPARTTTPSLATRGPVLIVGSGLIGASIGLALATHGVPVRLSDASPSALALARDVGAGQPSADADDGGDVRLVVVAVPPDVTADVVARELRAHPGAVVTDVASVKGIVLEELADADLAAEDLARYVGSHPMAGRERSGAAAADADLFAGRPWVIVDHGSSSPDALMAVRHLAVDVGASPVQLSAREHDEAVALVSHLPQVIASLVASRLQGAPESALALAGQGLRDVTRIAASDPQLWAAILVGNAGPVAATLAAVRDDLAALVSALDEAAVHGPLTPGSMAAASGVVARGNAGVARIPGKHGGARRTYGEVTVLVPDRPGELGRLFGEVGEIGVNIEDFQMEHAPRQRVGMAVLSVLPASVTPLEEALQERGWRVVSA
ncbi:prephenate dehydrogenase [Beutenbergia cavernae]|uniref:prephenate dehydrogenase n=1 Tax=Beutenbergia cavernae TaxID=84757 RepID=UPI00019AC5F6|nr:prephenate dehydrogenase [Beutenbergia cavernae]